MPNGQHTRHVGLERVAVNDAFWKGKIDLVRQNAIPYQWEVLNDRVPGAESYCLHNFRAAGRCNRGEAERRPLPRTEDGYSYWPEDPQALGDGFYGFVFQDSDIAKWIEAAAYMLAQSPDAALEARVDEAIELICAAQLPDGYLDTFYILSDPEARFTNLCNNHELYCFGHMTEAAVAYFRATGKRRLLDAMCRYADCIMRAFGPGEGQRRGYPGHEIAEMALVRLYEATGEEKYLALARYFIDERGRRPYYFDVERGIADGGEEKYQYNQAHRPVREQDEAVGHAVRAVYLYSGMADIARITGEPALREACERLWNDIVRRKLYITGGIGSTHHLEAFSYAYDLPNDLVYAESCASVGMAFFARRMLELAPKAEYADILELELYNGAISGMGLDGQSFFYVNPLEVVPEACRRSPEVAHVKPVRQKWFGCACCPPNIARLVASVGSYIYAERRDALYVNLYIGSEYRGADGFSVKLESGFPCDGRVRLHVTGDGRTPRTLALRIPGWCDAPKLELPDGMAARIEDGYWLVSAAWKDAAIALDFPMRARVVEADPRVREDIGKAAVVRGPMVYCLEETDNGPDLHLLRLRPGAAFSESEASVRGERVIALSTTGERRVPAGAPALYSEWRPPVVEAAPLRFIPYYAWANRGEGEMQVWTRV